MTSTGSTVNFSVDKINQEVCKRYPEMRGVKPHLQQQGQNLLLTYQTQVVLTGEKTMNRSVRVVVDESGKILKISSSR
jgi:hypothetical protein